MKLIKLNKEQIKGEKSRRIARSGTLIFHGLLFALILFQSLKPVEKPLEDSGILINFGTSKEGSGKTQPKKPIANKPKATPKKTVKKVIPKPIKKVEQPKVWEPVKKAPAPKPIAKYTPPKPIAKPVIKKKVLTQDIVKAPISAAPKKIEQPKIIEKPITKPYEKPVETPKPIKEVIKPVETKPIPKPVDIAKPIQKVESIIEEQVVDISEVVKPVERKKLNLNQPVEKTSVLKYENKPAEIKEVERELTYAEKFFSNKSKTGNAQTSEGKYENKSGDQGQIEGVNTPGNIYSERSTGLGSESVTYGLKGRTMLNKISIADNSQDVGIVVIKIKVDKYGNVIYTEYTQKGSTSSSARLVAKAKEASKQAQFNSDPLAPEIQFGTITFDFRYK